MMRCGYKFFLHAKYLCGDGQWPIIKKKQNSSLKWRGICGVRDTFKAGVGRKIRNGKALNFWFDNFLSLIVLLLILYWVRKGFIDRNDQVSKFVTAWGERDMRKLEMWLDSDSINRLMRAHSPCEERGEDTFYWKLVSDSFFSIKSAYNFLFTSSSNCNSNIWK